MSAFRDQAARRRLDLDPLSTSINNNHQSLPLTTPISAVSHNSLSTPFGYNPQAYTPVSAVRQYNPQQWASPQGVHPDHGGQYPRPQLHDPEAVSPAPPPYSPPRSQRPAPTDEPSGVIPSPAARASPANVYRSSPEASSNAVFAPTNMYRSSPEPPSNAVFHPPPPPPTRLRQNRPQSIHFYSASSFNGRPAPDSPLLVSELNREYVPNSMRPQAVSLEAQQYEDTRSMDAGSRPPASRRAVSTGAIDTPSSSRSRGSSTSRWEPGMPLPPPPPNPPPQSRSQSMNRSLEHPGPDPVVSPPTRRPGHSSILGSMSNLGPVPPTPAGWVDEDSSSRGKSPDRGLHMDTSSSGSGIGAPESSNSGSNSGGNSGGNSTGLTRTRAVRGEPKSIRERRSESRTRAVEEPSNNPWAAAISPADHIPPLTILGRRPPVASKTTPRSARSNNAETPKTGELSQHSTPVQGMASRGSTPRPLASSSHPEAATPPFSPSQAQGLMEGSSTIPPKALPTPPPQSRPQSRTLESPGKIPNSEVTRLSRPTSRQSNAEQLSLVTPSDQFARAAIERHQAFALKEAAASSDSERVRIFADFIVAESRLRRDRYASAIDAMGSEILELTRDLFRPYSRRRGSSVSRSSGWTPESSTGVRSHRNSITAIGKRDGSPSQSQPEAASSSGPPSPALARNDPGYWNSYMPSLSPIPSMSVSEALEGSSRGRPSSRWWEVSDAGSIGHPSMKLERSKRESKYMGMPKELRERLQYEDRCASNPGLDGDNAAGPSNSAALGPGEYPPEKVGWHEQGPTSPHSRVGAISPAPFTPQPLTPNPDHLDVSRLVTLPPPYPRHHPAVNNNHPDLTSIRTAVRSLSDFTEVEATKERFIQNSARLHEELESAASKRKSSRRVSIQREIESGNMSFADAAKAEAEAEVAEHEKTKAAIKADFENFQTQVVSPLNDLLQDRVKRATELFEQLRSKLFVDAQQSNPTSTQEEGDEQPELLEKLTLLKWIFEARELLQKELFDLLSDRNDRYKDLMIAPYRLAGNNEKVAGAEKFFAEDALRRRLTNDQEVLKRTEEFMDIIEENVVRGVEVQLSAFWDIAPALSRIIDKIPTSLHGFQIQIPSAEYEENPSYYEFPMQYLHSLLAHCKKSTYQFIESQTNLLCLLHEVKSGVTVANCRLMRTQRVAQGEAADEVDRELKEVEKDEEVRLTDDLKEKVRCVDEQWSSALGTELTGVEERIVTFLVEQGGWVDDE
ncbi:hypothetical protein M430DRAFT_21152 [Amorphotheca resinae ATCC 22711]|uniref:Uncharacterized protein n=1 Tax=Amorphotheca resinae ATCC 22711 TaxID=857342 RepID=A0A2T3AX62_AMORE|nr:hypothetical protein M430DRAFT_21152 [Amorphotheca resinae ATCC 22711]PSS13243.1 hypothetical protein M430DRAFT_21152 [Amorphotheca resinae ATCC 22711]